MVVDLAELRPVALRRLAGLEDRRLEEDIHVAVGGKDHAAHVAEEGEVDRMLRTIAVGVRLVVSKRCALGQKPATEH